MSPGALSSYNPASFAQDSINPLPLEVAMPSLDYVGPFARFSRLALPGLVCLAVFPSAARSAASIRPDGLLEVDGSPFFPVGLVDIGYWRYPTDWNDRIRQTKANLVWDVESAYADTLPACAALVDSAQSTGYKLIVGSGDTWNWDDMTTPEFEVDQQMYESHDLPNLQGCLGAAPGLVLGYANRDEAQWVISRGIVGDIDESHVLATYDQLHQDLGANFVTMNFAQVHLSGSLDQWKADLLPYLDATDIVLHASYPYPAGPGTCAQWNVFSYPECAMDRLVTAADTFLGELNKPGQPLWMIVQTHKSIPLKEARWEAHAAIVHGATGVLFAGWTWAHPLGNGWDNWSTAVQVVNEVAALQPHLIGVDLPVSSNHPDVEVRAKQAGRSVTVIAISRNGYSGQATINLPSVPTGIVGIHVANEGRVILAKGGTVTDRFDGYESHVYQYKLKLSVGGGETLAPPREFALETYPNPSAGRTTIRFGLPEESTVLVSVYDAGGRRVATLGRGNWSVGGGEVVWSGRDDAGRQVAPGVYFVRARSTDGHSASARVMITR
ncbi:MAG: FlgD immunoglobulin-like domain containing protein [Candidatus Eiseniibacteriota bacterium]